MSPRVNEMPKENGRSGAQNKVGNAIRVCANTGSALRSPLRYAIDLGHHVYRMGIFIKGAFALVCSFGENHTG
jgi:hypothetical protein